MVHVRVGTLPARQLSARLLPLLAEVAHHLEQGAVVSLAERRYRIRRLPIAASSDD